MSRNTGKDPAPTHLNGHELLLDIAERYWRYSMLSGRQRDMLLKNLALAHSQVVTTFQGPCPMCQGTEFVRRAPRNSTFQCLNCRRIMVKTAS